ncbi:MAG: SMC family ATPase [Coprothermobacterota bacterium]|nr:SMC family ATPase [Coprothermobacterota bacterium]
MRLKRLVLENFMPYRQVDLDFSRLGLFAIVGDTGSGKSSLVDAICFALYDETPRLKGKPREELIAKGANGYRVSLSFSLGLDEFEVVRQGRFGNPTQQFSLVRNGIRLPIINKREFDRYLAQTLLMMSYEIFTQIIVLPQGKFDRFLKPNQPRDRRDTLIDLLGLRVYEEIGKKASDHKSRWEAQLAVLERDLQGIDLDALSDEALTVLEEEINTGQSSAAELADKLTVYQQEQASLGASLTKLDQKTALEREQSGLEATDPEMKALEERLQRALALTALLPSWRQLEEDSAEETQLAHVQSRAASEASSLRQNLQQARDHQAQLLRRKEERNFEEALARWERETVALSGLIPQVTRLEGLREQEVGARHAVSKLRAQLSDCLVRSQSIGLSCRANEAATTLAERNHDQLIRRKVERDFEGTQAALEMESTSLADLLPTVTRLEGLRAREEKTHTGLERLRRQLGTHQLSSDRARAAQAAFELALVDQVEVLRRAEETWRHAQEEHLALALQAGLKEGDPCPVCGAPIRTLAPHHEENLSAAELSWKSARENHQKTQERLSEAQKGRAVLASQESNCRNQIIEEEKALALLTIEEAELRSTLPREFATEERLGSTLKNRLDLLQERRDALRNEQRKLEKEIEEAQRRTEETRRKLAEAHQEQAVLASQDIGIRSRMTESEGVLAGLSAQLDQERGKIRTSCAATVLPRLAESSHPQVDLEKELNGLGVRRGLLQEEQRTLDLALQDAQNRFLKESAALAAKEQEAVALAARLEQTRASQERQRRQLEESAENLGYARWVEARKDLLDEATLVREGARLQDFRSAKSRIAGGIELLEKDLGGRGRAQTQQSYLETDQAARSTREAQQRQNTLLMELNQRRSRLLERREFLRSRQEQRETVRKQLAVYAQLARDFSSRGMINHVANHIIEELLEEANRHLRSLSNGRYELELERDEDRNEDRIVVLDGYTSAPPRDISTLSGGETFLASLALALSVKSLLARTRQLGCFFIDEGFGTLDERTVQEVGNVLEMLKADGNQVGIITHRRDLVERFEDVLEVTNDQGLATLHWRGDPP